MSNLSQFLAGSVPKASYYTGTGSNTFVKPTNVSWVNVLLVGAGGGGQDGSNFNDWRGGGGGGEVVLYEGIYLTGNITASVGSGVGLIKGGE